MGLHRHAGYVEVLLRTTDALVEAADDAPESAGILHLLNLSVLFVDDAYNLAGQEETLHVGKADFPRLQTAVHET